MIQPQDLLSDGSDTPCKDTRLNGRRLLRCDLDQAGVGADLGQAMDQLFAAGVVAYQTGDADVRPQARQVRCDVGGAAGCDVLSAVLDNWDRRLTRDPAWSQRSIDPEPDRPTKESYRR